MAVEEESLSPHMAVQNLVCLEFNQHIYPELSVNISFQKYQCKLKTAYFTFSSIKKQYKQQNSRKFEEVLIIKAVVNHM